MCKILCNTPPKSSIAIVRQLLLNKTGSLSPIKNQYWRTPARFVWMTDRPFSFLVVISTTDAALSAICKERQSVGYVDQPISKMCESTAKDASVVFLKVV